MIVIDASAMVEALVGAAPDSRLLDLLAGEVHAPHLLDVEVASVLGGLTLGSRLDEQTAQAARHDFGEFTIVRHEFAPLAERVWQLRHQFTSYDASYIALAEGLDAPLVTCDGKLATGGHSAQVRLMASAAAASSP